MCQFWSRRTLCKLNKVSNFTVQCTGHTISARKSVKYLGIEIDQHVSGKKLPNMSSAKLMPGLSFFIDRQNIWTTTVANFFVPHSFNACLIVPLALGFQASMQNFRTNSKQLKIKWSTSLLRKVPAHMLVNLNVLKLGTNSVDDRVKFLCLCHAHKVFYNTYAPYLSDNFIRVSEVHRYNTRNSSFNFRLPKVKGAAFSTFFNYAIHDWNSLPNEIKKIKHLHQVQ